MMKKHQLNQFHSISSPLRTSQFQFLNYILHRQRSRPSRFKPPYSSLSTASWVASRTKKRRNVPQNRNIKPTRQPVSFGKGNLRGSYVTHFHQWDVAMDGILRVHILHISKPPKLQEHPLALAHLPFTFMKKARKDASEFSDIYTYIYVYTCTYVYTRIYLYVYKIYS